MENKTKDTSFNIFTQINTERSDFFTKRVQLAGKQASGTSIRHLSKVGGSYTYNQYELIQLIDMYWNSKFTSGEKDEQGRQKLFMNVGKFRTEVASKQIDIDVKDFLFIPEDYASTIGAWLMQQEFKDYAKESYFGDLINEAVETLPKYGTAVFKKVNKKLTFVPIQTLRNDQTAKSLNDAAHVIEEHPDMSMSDIQNMKQNGWTLDGFSMSFGKTTTIHERVGYVPKWYLAQVNDQPIDDIDADEVVDALFIISFDTTPRSKKNKESGHIFFAQEITKRPYTEVHWSKQHGRWLGTGEMENQIPNQVAKNVVVNILKKSFEWSSKRLFQSQDEEVANNLAREVQDGDVLLVGTSGEIKQIDMSAKFGVEAAQMMNEWERNSDQKSFTYEIATGEKMPSGTPFRLGVMLSNAANSHFALKQEKLASFLKKGVIEYLIPDFIKKAVSGESTVLVNSDMPGFNVIRQAAEEYTTTQVMKASLFSGKLIDMELIKQLVDPVATAHQIFVVRATDYYSNIKAKFNLVVTGEETDVEKRIASLTTLYQILAAQQDPRAEKVLERVLALSGENISMFGGATPPLIPGAPSNVTRPKMPQTKQPSNLDIPETTQVKGTTNR